MIFYWWGPTKKISNFQNFQEYSRILRNFHTITKKIQISRNNQDGLIINAGGYTHTSVAIHDALKILKIPILVLKHNAGKYWQNKKFIKKAGTIQIQIFPVINKINKKKLFVEKIKELFY